MRVEVPPLAPGWQRSAKELEFGAFVAAVQRVAAAAAAACVPFAGAVVAIAAVLAGVAGERRQPSPATVGKRSDPTRTSAGWWAAD